MTNEECLDLDLEKILELIKQAETTPKKLSSSHFDISFVRNPATLGYKLIREDC